MDSLNSNGPGALALEPLCQGAAQELLMRSYTIRTVNRYKRVWKQLADFVRAQGLPAEYTRELALRFEQAYGVRDGEVLKLGQQWRRHLVFGIKVLDDFARRDVAALQRALQKTGRSGWVPAQERDALFITARHS